MEEINFNKTLKEVASNIQTKKRPNNLIEIGEKINWLITIESKKEIAKKLSISEGMLSKFLSVFNVSEPVKELIQSRKIDSVFSVYALKSLNPNEQLILAKEIASKTLNSQQARALIPLKNIFPDEKIGRLIDIIKTTKDSNQYVNHFPYTGEANKTLISKRISAIVGGEPFTLINDNNIGIFKITKKGVKEMREYAKSQKMGFHSFLLKLFNPQKQM